VQQELLENAKAALGQDVMWWLMPTHPEMKINYMERVWPKRVIKKMYKTEEFDRE